MTAISNSSHGTHVVGGQYEHAIDRIESRPDRSFDANTNLCVAYTKTGALDSAQKTCEAALEEGRRSFRFGSPATLGAAVGRSNPRTNLALALSNRGVLYAAQLKPDLARKDFVAAIELDSGLAAPEQNLARLEQERTTEVISQAK